MSAAAPAARPADDDPFHLTGLSRYLPLLAFPIRWRLSLLYTFILTLSLLAADSLVYLALLRYMTQEVDDNLAAQAQEISGTTGLLVNPAASPIRPSIGLPNIDVFSSPGVSVQVIDLDGTVIRRSESLGERTFPANELAMGVAVAGGSYIETTYVGGAPFRVYYAPLDPPFLRGNVAGVLQIARSLKDLELALAQLRVFFVVIGFLSVLVAAVGGWWLARVALRPIDRLTRDAHTIGESRDFGRRVAAPRGETPRDEVERLATTFNEMLAELQEAYQEQEQTLASQRRFVADASHELRTPLSTIRTNLELLQRAGDELHPADRDEALADSLAEVERLSRLVGDLLTLARVDSGQRLERRDVVRVDRLVRDVYRQARLLALPHEHALVVEPVEEAAVLGDADYLKELLLILVDNAVSYTPDGGHIRLSVERVGDEVRIAVADDGVGIEAADLPHLFERFYRADRTRARAAGSNRGTGLGLSIAKWIADEHGGRIDVESAPGRGSTFTIVLPAAPVAEGVPTAAAPA
ncbi:MAG: HAMP domain-containing histidine kinase [Chloroflexota bacterium]|nr:HAMP domain-containing histidine kinase [Chloroflexota bacterium]